jgi:hypothetical protein
MLAIGTGGASLITAMAALVRSLRNGQRLARLLSEALKEVVDLKSELLDVKSEIADLKQRLMAESEGQA